MNFWTFLEMDKVNNFFLVPRCEMNSAQNRFMQWFIWQIGLYRKQLVEGPHKPMGA